MNALNLVKFPLNCFNWLKKQLNSDARITKIESKIERLDDYIYKNIDENIRILNNQINSQVNNINSYHIVPIRDEIKKLNIRINSFSSKNETNRDEILQVISMIEPLIKTWVEEMLRHKSKAEAVELQDNLVKFQRAIDSLKKAQKRIQACKEAATCLANQQKNLLKQVSEFIFNYDKWKENNENVDLSEQKKKLGKEIDICLDLLSNYLSNGRKPAVLLKRILNYTPEEVNIYFNIYGFIRENMIYNQLSPEAILELESYFNEYLIKPLYEKKIRTNSNIL